MELTRQQKLQTAFEYIRNRGIVRTQRDLVDLMGVNKATVSQAFNDRRGYLTDSFFLKFNAAVNGIFNNEWLIGDADEMLAQPLIPNAQPATAVQPKQPAVAPVVNDEVLMLRSHNKTLAEENKRLMELIAEKDKQLTKLMEMVLQKLN